MKTVTIEDKTTVSTLYSNDNNIIFRSAVVYKFMVGWAIEDVKKYCKINSLSVSVAEGING